MKSYGVTIQMKATEQYFPVVLFIMLYKVVLTFESVDERNPLSNETYSVELCMVLFISKNLCEVFGFVSRHFNCLLRFFDSRGAGGHGKDEIKRSAASLFPCAFAF